MDMFTQLARPFPPNLVSWRVGSTNAKKLGCKPWEATEGTALAYIDARDVMKRLDDVCGPANWQCRYPLADSGLLICEIGIRVPDDNRPPADWWVWKANGAGDTQVEAEKGKASDAFKRAAVLWGVGRYLYALPSPWVPLKNGRLVKDPILPDWATPEGFDRIMEKRAAA